MSACCWPFIRLSSKKREFHFLPIQSYALSTTPKQFTLSGRGQIVTSTPC